MQIAEMIAIGALAAMAAVLMLLLHSSVERQVAAFSAFFAGHRPDPWPIGVQEEDRDRPWGWSERRPPREPTAARAAEDDSAGRLEAADEPAPVDPVRPLIRGRH